MDAIYSTSATAHGGRNGRVTTSSGRLDLEVATPPELGGDAANTDKSNPEELFACGYAACFHSALQLVAGKREIDISGSTVTVTAGGRGGGGSPGGPRRGAGPPGGGGGGGGVGRGGPPDVPRFAGPQGGRGGG